MSTDRNLEMACCEQIQAVDRRTRTGGNYYGHERAEIRAAADFIATAQGRLGLGPFTRSLTPPTGKPQMLLGFRSARYGDVVLKVYGRHRPNEAAVQRLWSQAGVATVPILESEDDPVSWMLMPLLDARPPTDVGLSSRSLTPAVARILRDAHHVYDESIGTPMPLAQGIMKHLDGVVRSLQQHGYRVQHHWAERALEAWATTRTVFLHGDLTPVNLLVGTDGSVIIIDSCGYRGAPEYDCARWAARVGGSTRAVETAQQWMQEESNLDSHLVMQLLAHELLHEAGVREIKKDEQQVPYAARDPETQALLDLYCELAE